LQASNAFLSAGAAAPDEFYDLYTMDLEPEGQWARARRRFMQHRLAVASLIILAIVFAAGFLSSHIAPFGYEEVNINALSSAPSWSHPFGTDQVGRDYFSRTLYGLKTEAEIAPSDGRKWAKPVRAARASSSPDVLWEDARVYSFGDVIGYGGTTAVAAARGTVHPLWIDTRDLGGKKQEVFGATLP
jgi:hypothetical protein